MRTLAFVLLASGASALIAPTALRSIRTAASPALAVRRAAPVVLQGDYTQKTRLAEEASAPFAKVPQLAPPSIIRSPRRPARMHTHATSAPMPRVASPSSRGQKRLVLSGRRILRGQLEMAPAPPWVSFPYQPVLIARLSLPANVGHGKLTSLREWESCEWESRSNQLLARLRSEQGS